MRRRAFIGATTALAVLSAWPLRLRAAGHNEKPVIALFGATARSGREIIRQGLDRGHTIKGFARTPSKLGIEHENLTLFKGDIYERDTIDPVLEGHEVVVSMISVSAPEDPSAEIGPVDIYTVMGEHLIAAMKAKGNTLVQIEEDFYRTEYGGTRSVRSPVVVEYRDGKRWREWRFKPQDK